MLSTAQYARGPRWARRIAIALGGVAILLFALSFALANPTPAYAQGTPPTCSSLVQGTRFTLPAMTVGQEATVPAVADAKALCVEGLEGAESVGFKLTGQAPYTANGNGTALTVSEEFTSTMALLDPSANGSVLKAAPALPAVKIVALTDLSDGVTILVGSPKAATVAVVVVDQWSDVRIPGSLGELRAGTTKWSGNGLTVKVKSGAAFTANGDPVLPEPGELGEFEMYVDGTVELVLEATANGQRFYLSVDAAGLDPSAWLQKRVEPKPIAVAVAPGTVQYKNAAGQYFLTADCTGAPVPQDPAAETRTCGGTQGDVWSPDPTPPAPATHPAPFYLPLRLR